MGLLSEGGYHDDGLTHYLYAKWAWGDLRYLVDEWGRPGQTCLLFPIAWAGWTACRVAQFFGAKTPGAARYNTARCGHWVPVDRSAPITAPCCLGRFSSRDGLSDRRSPAGRSIRGAN